MSRPKSRCAWAGSDPLYVAYHDKEWGRPSREAQHLFEMLVLEGAQAGLSWITILRKREAYRRAFDGFNPEKMAHYSPGRVRKLLADPSIVRNRLKIEGAVRNAQAFLELRDHDDVVAWFWQFVDGKPKLNRWTRMGQVPPRTPESDAMSRALRQRGFTFVGSTICYAFMQATGMVNDHLTTCFRYPGTVPRARLGGQYP